MKLKKDEMALVKDDIMVIVDFEYIKGVDDAYRARMFIKTIQDLRKDTKLKPWNKIGIYYDTEDKNMLEILDTFYDDICEELVYSIASLNECGAAEPVIVEKECDVYGVKMKIKLTYKDD